MLRAALGEVLGGADRLADRVAGRGVGRDVGRDGRGGGRDGRCVGAFTVLIYHRIGGRTPSPVDLPLEVFRAQLDLLAEQATVVSLDDALAGAASAASAAGGASHGSGPRRVVLSFDDGTADWAEVVQPELHARGMPATFYVATDFVDRALPWPDDGRPISWAALAGLAADELFTVGSHTHTHRVLAGSTAQETADELRRAADLLGEHLGAAPRHFAYPKAIAPNAAAEVMVRRMCASAALAGNSTNTVGGDRYRLGRHALTVADSLDDFAAKVAGGRRLEGWARARRDAWRRSPR